MNNGQQEDTKRQIKSVLDRSVDELSVETRYQLQIRRAQVLNNQSKSKWWSKWSVFGGITVFASISALAAFLLFSQPQFQPQETNMMSELDAVFFEADTNIELYEQYDFYVWLSQQESNG